MRSERTLLTKKFASPLFVWIVIVGIVSLSSIGRAAAGESEVDVVVGKSASVTTLSADDVRKIFVLDRTSWPGGKRVNVLMLGHGAPERAVILKDVYRMTETDYARYFLQAAFAGRITAPPREVSSVSQMKQLLEADPNAIGYLAKGDLSESVKVIFRIQ